MKTKDNLTQTWVCPNCGTKGLVYVVAKVDAIRCDACMSPMVLVVHKLSNILYTRPDMKVTTK